MDAEDVEYLNSPWRIKIETETATHDIPLESIPQDFYTFVEVDGNIEIENLARILEFHKRGFKIEPIDPPILEVKIVKNILYDLVEDFFEEKPKIYFDKEIQKLKKLKNEKSYKDYKCPECNKDLYASEKDFLKSKVSYSLCYQCADKTLEKCCSLKGCSNQVTRSHVTGKAYPFCNSCFYLNKY